MKTASPLRSRRVRRAGTLLLAALTAASLAGCASTSASETDEGLDSITVVTFLPLESFSFTPEMYASAGGFFEKHGLDVELQPVQGTSAAIQSLIGGAAMITRASTVDVFPAMEDGQPVVAVGTMANKSNLRVASLAAARVASPEDMRGKTIGMGSVGGTSEKMLDLALTASDIPLDEVQRQAVPVTAATLELVRKEQLAGFIVSMDTAFAIMAQNDDAYVDDAGLGDSPDLQTWLITQSTMDDPEKADQTTRFLAAIREAMESVRDDEANGFANVLKTLRDSGDFSFAALEDDEVAVQALTAYINDVWPRQDTGEFLVNDPDGWQNAYDVYVDAGQLDGGGDPAEWITDELLPADGE